MGEQKSWMDTLSETVDKATKAASEAWDGTADLRKDAWEKTKTAASSASDALNQGVEQAKRSFDGTDPSAPDESAPQAEPSDDEPEDQRGDATHEHPPLHQAGNVEAGRIGKPWVRQGRHHDIEALKPHPDDREDRRDEDAWNLAGSPKAENADRNQEVADHHPPEKERKTGDGSEASGP